MSTAIVSAVIAGVFSIICALIARSSGPRVLRAAVEEPISPYPWSNARWLSWIASVAWIIPLFGFPFGLLALGYSLRDQPVEVKRRVPAYVRPIAVVSLILTTLNAIWGAYQGYHGQQFWQHGG